MQNFSLNTKQHKDINLALVKMSTGFTVRLVNSKFLFVDILRLFNPKLKGYSTGTRFSQEKDWWFNVAVPGAKAK